MDVQRHQQLHSQLFVSQRLRHQWLFVVDRRPRPLTVPHIHEEVSGCLSVLPDWPLSLVAWTNTRTPPCWSR